jgi:zinc-ribbon family
MALIIYGTSKVDVGVDEIMIECPSCEAQNFSDIMISSRYFHIFFMPIFPLSKETTIICKKCGLKRVGLDFKGRTLQNYQELNSKFKHPYITYVGISLVMIIIIGAIITNLLR